MKAEETPVVVVEILVVAVVGILLLRLPLKRGVRRTKEVALAGRSVASLRRLVKN